MANKNNDLFTIVTVSAKNEMSKRKFATPRNVVDRIKFVADVQAVATFYNYHDLAYKVRVLAEKVDALAEGDENGVVDESALAKAEADYENAVKAHKRVKDTFNVISTDEIMSMPMLPKVVVYSVFSFSRSYHGNKVYIGGNEGMDILQAFADGDRTTAKTRIIDLAQRLLTVSEDSEHYREYKNYRCKLTDAQVNELFTAYKGVERTYNVKGIVKRRCTDRNLLAQCFLCVLEKTFEFKDADEKKNIAMF